MARQIRKRFTFRSGSVTEQNEGSAPCPHKSPTREAGAGTEEKRFCSGAVQPGRVGDSHLKDYHIFLLKPEFLIRTEGLFSYPIIFLLIAFNVLGLYPFIFLAFGELSARIFPSCLLGQ